MASQYTARVTATLVRGTLQQAIDKEAKSANIKLSNVTVDTSKLVSEIEKALSKTNFKINVTGLGQQIGQQLGKDITKEVQSSLGKTKVSGSNVAGDIKKATKAVQEFTKAQKEQAQAAKEAAQQQLTLTKASTLSNNIQAWMNNNTVAAKHFGAELDSIKQKLSSQSLSGKELQQLSAEFQNIKARANSAGMVVRKFATSLKDVGLMALGINSTYSAITKLISTINDGVDTVMKLDTALVDLKKTTTMSDNDLAQFYRTANDEAKRLGVTTEEIINQAAAWSRLGYGSKEDATRMASLSSQFAMISPGMSTNEAQESLVSTMKAFGITTDEVLDGIMSKVNILGNSFALSNKDLADALQVSSASMNAANNSFEQTLALITAGTEITQDASRVGNGLRTISMRIRGRHSMPSNMETYWLCCAS